MKWNSLNLMFTLRSIHKDIQLTLAFTQCYSVLHRHYRRPPVLSGSGPGLPGRRLSARRRCPCQTTAFCWHSNTRCQLDVQQLWRQDLCRRRTTSLEQSAAQSQTMWAVIRPVQAVAEDIFIRSEAMAQRELLLTAPNRNILTYLLTYMCLY